MPKDEELVATPYRHGGKDAAEQFFLSGMARALNHMCQSGIADFPITLYYAFKQSEVSKEGLTSAGWATFLQAVFDSGYVIDGTWPMRTENASRMIGQGSNALASLHSPGLPQATSQRTRHHTPRIRCKATLSSARRTGKDPGRWYRSGGHGAGFDRTRDERFHGGLEGAGARRHANDGTHGDCAHQPGAGRDLGEEATGYDADTRFCIDWFEAFGMDKGKSGDAITMAQAYDIGIDDLENAGSFSARGGSARLLRRDELPTDWDPETDKRLTDWECAQHLVRALESPAGGIDAAALLYSKMAPERGEAARMLAYRLYDICERKDRAAEAQVWNMLAREWPALEAAAAEIATAPRELSLL